MTVDEKITRLQESAMQEARSKGNAIVEQHKKALTHVFEQHKAEALIQADTRIKAEKTSSSLVWRIQRLRWNLSESLELPRSV